MQAFRFIKGFLVELRGTWRTTWWIKAALATLTRYEKYREIRGFGDRLESRHRDIARESQGVIDNREFFMEILLFYFIKLWVFIWNKGNFV